MLKHLNIENIKTISDLSAKLHETLIPDFGTRLEQYVQSLSLPAKHELAALFLIGKGEPGSYDQQLQRVTGSVGGLHLTLRKQSRLPMFLSQGGAKLGIDLTATEEPQELAATEEVEEAAHE